MVGMAKATKVQLISDVYSSRSVWKEGYVYLRLKNITNKLWEKTAEAWGMKSGIINWAACSIQKHTCTYFPNM
jgi:hypothetical protein